MNHRLLLSLTCALFLAITAGCANQKSGTDHYEPLIAQDGKDVMWMPTPNELVTEMLEIAQVTSVDLVYDLGAGDGKIAIEAARRYGAWASNTTQIWLRLPDVTYNKRASAIASLS